MTFRASRKDRFFRLASLILEPVFTSTFTFQLSDLTFDYFPHSLSDTYFRALFGPPTKLCKFRPFRVCYQPATKNGGKKGRFRGAPRERPFCTPLFSASFFTVDLGRFLEVTFLGSSRRTFHRLHFLTSLSSLHRFPRQTFRDATHFSHFTDFYDFYDSLLGGYFLSSRHNFRCFTTFSATQLSPRHTFFSYTTFVTAQLSTLHNFLPQLNLAFTSNRDPLFFTFHTFFRHRLILSTKLCHFLAQNATFFTKNVTFSAKVADFIGKGHRNRTLAYLNSAVSTQKSRILPS